VLKYLVGDATRPVGGGEKIITHCCNDLGRWGSGFVVPLGRLYPSAKFAYHRWCEGLDDPSYSATGLMGLGEIQFVQVEPHLWVVNIIGQHGVIDRTPAGEGPPIRYEAIRQGFAKLRGFATLRSASVHMPRMGAGLAGGQWEEIEKLINAELLSGGLDVFVYDLPTKEASF
jgi:O-acetyl-ADP-ribose deacetylase (regulator of RNase III)